MLDSDKIKYLFKNKKTKRKLVILLGCLVIGILCCCILFLNLKNKDNKKNNNEIIKNNVDSLKSEKYDSDGYAIDAEHIGKLDITSIEEVNNIKADKKTKRINIELSNLDCMKEAFISVADYITKCKGDYNAYSSDSYENIIARYVSLIYKDDVNVNSDGYILLDEEELQSLAYIVFGNRDLIKDDIKSFTLIKKKDDKYAVKKQDVSDYDIEISKTTVDTDNQYYVTVKVNDKKMEYTLMSNDVVTINDSEYKYSITNAYVR